jgi:hypothetical protein
MPFVTLISFPFSRLENWIKFDFFNRG